MRLVQMILSNGHCLAFVNTEYYLLVSSPFTWFCKAPMEFPPLDLPIATIHPSPGDWEKHQHLANVSFILLPYWNVICSHPESIFFSSDSLTLMLQMQGWSSLLNPTAYSSLQPFQYKLSTTYFFNFFHQQTTFCFLLIVDRVYFLFRFWFAWNIL